MENGGADSKQKLLIDELRRGRKLARQLSLNLDLSSSSPSSSSNKLRESLVQKMVSSFTNALSLLKWSDSDVEQLPAPPNTPSTDSPVLSSISPRNENSDQPLMNQEHQDISNKRKTLPKSTSQVHVIMESGLEIPPEDGFSWRKYGQKDILGAKNPRGYYRCTYRINQGCLAKKQVQRSDTNPSVFNIIYDGKHTCCQTFPLIITSPENQQQQPQQEQERQQLLLNFKTGLKVKTKDLRNSELTSFSFPSTLSGNSKNGIFSPTTGIEKHLMGGFSPSFISPTTSESNYFSLSPVNCYGGEPDLQTSQTDLIENISAVTSSTKSQTVDLDLILEPVEFDPNFQFDTSNFFT